MKLYYLYTFFLFPLLLLSQVKEKQVSEKDSLLSLYTYANDIKKAKVSYDLSLYYKNIDMDTSLVYAETAKDIALQCNDYELYSKSLNRIGVIFMFTEKPLQAEKLFDKSNENCRRSKGYN